MADNISKSFSETGVPTRGVHRDLEATRQSLERWFTRALPDRRDVHLTALHIPSSSGVANETLMCDLTWQDETGPQSGGYVVRVNSPDFLYKDVDLAVHAEMYRALRDEPGIPVPAVVGYEPDAKVLGEAFFVMERLEGEVPGDTPPFHTAGFVFDMAPEDRHTLWRNAVEVMARVHQVDHTRLSFLERPHLGKSGLDQDLHYWLDYGAWAARGRAHPVLDGAAKWLRANTPAAPPEGLAWGDSRIPNLMFRDLKVVAVFDWDMVCLAGAESDLAWWTVMDYTNTEAGGVTRLPGIGSPVETTRLWQDLVGRPVENMHFHLVYAAYRLGIILVRLGDLYAKSGALPVEMTDEMATNNAGIQFLTQLLDIPNPGPTYMPWPGFDL
jgi:aminoglycoside phosphotransferase (APT) family kinase protein